MDSAGIIDSEDMDFEDYKFEMVTASCLFDSGMSIDNIKPALAAIRKLARKYVVHTEKDYPFDFVKSHKAAGFSLYKEIESGGFKTLIFRRDRRIK